MAETDLTSAISLPKIPQVFKKSIGLMRGEEIKKAISGARGTARFAMSTVKMGITA
jgi:hypothetical protein